MPLDLALTSGGQGTVPVPEPLLWDLPGQLAVAAPLWSRLGREAFDDPELGASEVPLLLAEVDALGAAWRAHRRAELARDHQVTAQDPAVRARLLDEVAAQRPDPVRDVLAQVRALCVAALARRDGIRGISD